MREMRELSCRMYLYAREGGEQYGGGGVPPGEALTQETGQGFLRGSSVQPGPSSYAAVREGGFGDREELYASATGENMFASRYGTTPVAGVSREPALVGLPSPTKLLIGLPDESETMSQLRSQQQFTSRLLKKGG